MKNDKTSQKQTHQNTITNIDKIGKDERIHSDVLGSYTGNPEGDDDRPIQDADDL